MIKADHERTANQSLERLIKLEHESLISQEKIKFRDEELEKYRNKSRDLEEKFKKSDARNKHLEKEMGKMETLIESLQSNLEEFRTSRNSISESQSAKLGEMEAELNSNVSLIKDLKARLVDKTREVEKLQRGDLLFFFYIIFSAMFIQFQILKLIKPEVLRKGELRLI